MKIGKYQGIDCHIDNLSPNQSVCVTGISGSGKTTRLYSMELDAVLNGKSVIVIDLNHTHTDDQICPQLRDAYVSKVNRIRPAQDGFALNLFEPHTMPDGTAEPLVSMVNFAVSALGSGQRMGPRQVGALRTAVVRAIKIRQKFASDAQTLIYTLAEQNSAHAKAVYEKLWSVLNSGVLGQSRKPLRADSINIIDLGGLDHTTGQTFAEIFLSALWRNVLFRSSDLTRNGILLVLDEFQNFSMKQDAALLQMLREGRKFALSLLLATQTLEVFPKEILAILNQTATRLYFRPAPKEIPRIVKEIDPPDPQLLKKRLAKLKVGEAIAVGDLNVRGTFIQRPILLTGEV